MDGSREPVEVFGKSPNISQPVLLDPAMMASKKYLVRSVPTTFFIDRNGNAKQVIAGEIPQKAFDKIVASML